MQSVARLPWSTAHLSGKLLDKPMMGFSDLANMKRKRTASPEPFSPPQTLTKKARPNLQQRLPIDVSHHFGQFDPSSTHGQAALTYATPGPTPTTACGESSYVDPAVKLMPTPRRDSMCDRDEGPASEALARDATTSEPADAVITKSAPALSALQQAIENQINMQILLKHDEARLINQELAKCQIALEQLRRCELRPYPGAQHPELAVTAGTGPAIQPAAGSSRPTHAAPHGLVDGPYSRHYRKWLLADPQFDSEPAARALCAVDTGAYASGRVARNGAPTARKSAAKAVQPAPQHDFFPTSLPNYAIPLPKKEQSGPLILRRSTDNKLVKLVCNDCNRGNMNSIQGFLNHCRIAHKVDYKSHDQAAVDCGRPLDDEEIASLPAEAQATPVSKPTRYAPARTLHTASATPLPGGAVHPLNTTGAILPRSKPSSVKKRAPGKPRSVKPSVSTHMTPFKPSAQAPRLSALFVKNNVGGDLEQAIAIAKQPVDFGAEYDLSSPRESLPNSPSVAAPGSVYALAGAPSRPVSRKGHRQPGQRPRPSPLAPVSLQQPAGAMDIPDSPPEHVMSLSPHTADSNPGLISDMEEDDDHGSASEDESHRLPPSRGSLLPVNRTCSDAMELDISVDDGMDEHSVIIRRTDMPGGSASTKMT